MNKHIIKINNINDSKQIILKNDINIFQIVNKRLGAVYYYIIKDKLIRHGIKATKRYKSLHY